MWQMDICCDSTFWTITVCQEVCFPFHHIHASPVTVGKSFKQYYLKVHSETHLLFIHKSIICREKVSVFLWQLQTLFRLSSTCLKKNYNYFFFKKTAFRLQIHLKRHFSHAAMILNYANLFTLNDKKYYFTNCSVHY